MHLLRRTYGDDEYESNRSYYSVKNFIELLDFIKDNKWDIDSVDAVLVPTIEQPVYIIEIFDSIVLRSIKIHTVR